MTKEQVFERGDAVLSLKGRDAGRSMVLLSLDGNCAFVCDGRKRKLERPKKKKLCHLKLLSAKCISFSADAELTNKKLWKSLERFRENISVKTGNDLKTE